MNRCIERELLDYLKDLKKKSEKDMAEIIRIVNVFLEETNKKLLEEAISELQLLSKSNAPCRLEAIWLLGFCYSKGYIVSHNRKTACDYFSVGVIEGHTGAQFKLGNIYVTGHWDVRKTGFELIEKSANQGHSPAQNLLATCYQYGLGTKLDIEKAIEVYKILVEKNDSTALYSLGKLYYEHDEYKNMDEAIRLLEKASELGCEEAPGLLGGICREKEPPDFKKAVKYYELAITLGDNFYQRLADIYRNEKYGVKDLNKALHYYKKILIDYIRWAAKKQLDKKRIDVKKNKEIEEILTSNDMQKMLDLYESPGFKEPTYTGEDGAKGIRSLKQLWDPEPSQFEQFIGEYHFPPEYSAFTNQLKPIMREYLFEEVSEDPDKDENKIDFSFS